MGSHMSFEVEPPIEREVRRLGNFLVVGQIEVVMVFDLTGSEIVVVESLLGKEVATVAEEALVSIGMAEAH